MSGRGDVPYDTLQVVPAHAHLGVSDTLLRFGAGVDRGDASLLASAFADDAIVDFRPCGRSLGLDFPVLHGAGAITAFLAGTTRTQVTSHVVSNTRVQADEVSGYARSLVDATHLVRFDASRRFRMMNWYEIDAVRSETHWRIRSLLIDNLWFDGDPQVLLVR